MYKRSELDKYERKIESMERKEWREAKKIVKKYSIILINWLFFYQYDEFMDALIHVITVCAWLWLGFFIASR